MYSTPKEPSTNGSANFSAYTNEPFVLHTFKESRKERQERKKRGDPEQKETIYLTLVQAKEALQVVRARAAGWQAGSASLVGLILASLVFRSDTAWMTTFSGWQLLVFTLLVALALICALVSMWFVLRAAHGPFTLDAKLRDYKKPYDAPRIFNRATTAASELKMGQWLLLIGVLLLAISMFGTWLMDPHTGAFSWR